LDEFIVQQLSDMSDEDSERFKEILEIKIEEVLEQSSTTQEYALLKKKREKLQTDIVAQTRNMREVDESIRCYLQDDIHVMSEELRETERMLFKLEESRKNSMVAVRDLEQTKERLLSFAEYAKDAQPEVLVTLIQTIVERIYIVDKDDERFCHIFIKGCTDEDYTGFFQTAGYIEQKTTPACDSEQYCICTKISSTGNL
jgi:site-specific DNA recombinase